MEEKQKETKRKKPIITAVIIILVVIGGYVAKQVYDNVNSYNVKEFVKENPKAAIAQAKEIEKVEYETGLSNTSDEDEVLRTMNQMCHQKIIADKKFGATPMTASTINEVYSIVAQSDFQNKEELLEILEDWMSGDFDRVDAQHDLILQMQGGNIGQSTGIMTEEQEAQYILENFGSDLN